MSLENSIKIVKNKRIKYKKRAVFVTALFIFFGISAFKITKNSFEYYDFILMPVFLMLGLFFIFLIVIITTSYKNYYKNFFIKSLVNDMGFEFKEEFVLLDEDIKNLIFLNPISNGTDRINGSFKGVKFQIFESVVAPKQDDNIIMTIFSCEFYKNFKTKTVCVDKKIFSKYFDKTDTPHKIILDNVDFNDKFMVYSTDKIEAKYLLSFGFMERILNLSKNVAGFIFIKNKFYLFMAGRDKFEGNIFKNDVNFKKAKEYQDEILEILGIIKELNLTLKIYKL